MVTATWRKTSRKRPGCAQAKRPATEQATAELVRRVRVGVATDAALAAPQTDVARERADLVVLAERLALRKEYLAKGTAADELARRLEVTQDLQAGRQALDVARLTLDAAQKAAAVGTGSLIEMLQADLALQERQLELARLAERLRRLEAVPPRDRAQSDSGGGGRAGRAAGAAANEAIKSPATRPPRRPGRGLPRTDAAGRTRNPRCTAMGVQYVEPGAMGIGKTPSGGALGVFPVDGGSGCG